MTRILLAALALTSCTPQVEVKTARAEPPIIPQSKPLTCEGQLPGMFENQDQCRILQGLEEAFGRDLDGGSNGAR